MAAEIFGDAARRLGLDPASMKPAVSEQVPEIEELETALARSERISRRTPRQQPVDSPERIDTSSRLAPRSTSSAKSAA